MFHRLVVKLALSVLIALVGATPAFAGCCLIVTLDRLPGQVVAGQPFDVGFTLRINHIPMARWTPEVVAKQADTGKSFTTTATEQGAVGHYVATLTLPEPGTWEWSINGQRMPPLIAPATSSPAEVNVSLPAWLPFAVGVLALFGAAGGALIALRTRARWSIALVAAALIVGGGSVALATRPTLAAPAAAPDQAAIGQALFVAKGCIACHRHDAVGSTVEFGPNLTNLQARPEFLRRWLKDPSAVRPGTPMPTLGLADDEIESLIAFLNAED
ncbi:MAG TPA: c-type cytochrome [Anaerolineae bacterium]|nr:c-type cytochrome [Anaerolineae bacterium]